MSGNVDTIIATSIFSRGQIMIRPFLIIRIRFLTITHEPIHLISNDEKHHPHDGDSSNMPQRPNLLGFSPSSFPFLCHTAKVLLFSQYVKK
jgi:hypothetical protein